MHEGIQLQDPARIEKDEGLRSLAKLMLNSHWGKFIQNPDKSKVSYVSDSSEYVAIMTDDTLEVTDLMYANKEQVAIRWRAKGEFVEALPNTNIKYLGVTIDNDLPGETMAHSVIGKVSRELKVLYRKRKYFKFV